jgi:PAS domain S-box-containing protein
MKILIVDADAARRSQHARHLRELGHELIECDDADRGCAELHERAPPEPSVELAVVAGARELATVVEAARGASPSAADPGDSPPAPSLRLAGVWVIALCSSAEDVGAAVAAGAHDCLLADASPAELGVRAAVAEARRSELDTSTSGRFIDVEERRRTAEALHKSEASLRSVLHASPDGIIVHSEGRFRFVNPAAVAQLGLAPDTDILGQAIYDRIKPEQVALVRERIETMVRTGQPAPAHDLHFVRADGEAFVGEVASIPGTFAGAPAIISIIRDVGEQRRMQSQLFLADRLATVGTLAVGVAHEINNPLSWVMGNLGLLADEFDAQVRLRERPGHDPALVAASRARVRDLLARAQEGTERVRRIVRDLGRFARFEDGDHQAVDIHALLDSTLEIADVQLRHRARLVRDYQGRGDVRGSEARLGQVFLNLLVNASQAIEPGSPGRHRVEIGTADLPDGRIEVWIRDTGCGMPERVRQRIFEPFYTTKRAGEGTGIGLAISHSIVSAAGGEIVVESEPDVGSCFRVRLLRAEDEIPSRPAAALRDRAIGGRSPVARVLVVDDEPLIREMVCDALAAHEVTAVATGQAAIAEIIKQDWDLILCDMILPESSGLEVFRELAQLRPEAANRLVFMTGGDASGRAPRLPNGARVRRLEKPFSIKRLRELADEAAGG